MKNIKFNPKVDYTNELIEECINNNDLVGLRGRIYMLYMS